MAATAEGQSTVQRKNRKATLRRGLGVMWIGIKQQPRSFSVAVVGSLMYGLMTVMTATAIGHVVAKVVEPAIARGSVGAGDLWYVFGVLTLVLVVNVIGVILRRVAAGMTFAGLGAIYRRRITRQYLSLPLSWHRRHPSGQLLSNANSDVESAWTVFNPLPMALGVIFMLVIAGVQMVLVDLWLALIGFLVFPALFAANLVFQSIMSPRITRVQQLRAEVSEVAHESFEAGLLVKSMGREAQETQRFSKSTNELRDAAIRVGRTRGVFEPFIEGIPTLGTLAVLSVGAVRVADGQLNAADVAQIAYLFSIIAFPVRAFGWVLAELPRSVVGWDRIQSVLQAGGHTVHGSQTLQREGAARSAAQDVHYTFYDRSDHEQSLTERTDLSDQGTHGTEATHAVRGVTLDVPAGSITALVGSTGSGKSTMASLMLRLFDADTGTVTLDDQDVRELAAGEIENSTALVAQQTFMFDDTVRGNVTLGKDCTDDEVWAALKVAQADGFVQALPQGIDTPVGERGGTLSGGQRQRIALARAVVRNPRLLVLDDATSAVDPSVEQAILSKLQGDGDQTATTVLVIAYRMATISLADHVVVMDGGRVLDQGTHTELIGRCEKYRELVTAYARDAEQRQQAEKEAQADAAPSQGAASDEEEGA